MEAPKFPCRTPCVTAATTESVRPCVRGFGPRNVSCNASPAIATSGAQKPTEIDHLLDAFFAQKAVHMAALGITNVFAAPGVAQILREACHQRLPDGRPVIEIHALECDGEVLALFGATIDPYRFSSMFNTYTLGKHARHSPGLVLLMHMIEDCVARGVRSFDIGVGRAQYKSFFCKEPEPLFDTFLPLTQRGRFAAPAVRFAYATGRFIKERPALWSAVQRLRRLRAR